MDLVSALRCFTRVVETGSFSAVARETGTSQSAVNRQVVQLEQHYGVRLLHRTTRRLSLTDDGRILLSHARHLLDTTEEMEAALGRRTATARGLVRLGVSVSAGLFLSPRLPALLVRHPGLQVELVMYDHVGDMVEDRLDLALRVGEIADTSLVARRVIDVGEAVVAAPVYLERAGAPATPADLASHICLLHTGRAEPDVWHFSGPDGLLTVQVSGGFTANDSAAILFAARAGHGIAMLPEVQVIDDLRAARLFRILVDYPSPRRPLQIVYPSRRNLAPRTRVVMDFLLEQVRDIPAMLAVGAEVLT